MQFDLVLSGGLLVDPSNGVESKRDIGILGGRVECVKDQIPATQAREWIDVSGLTVIPGVIDIHVHLTSFTQDRSSGHKMLARAGVTTAIGFSVPDPSLLLESIERGGAGLNIGGLYALIPEVTVQDPSPSRASIAAALETALTRGLLGLKLLGGHYPLTPEATSAAIELANLARAYVGYHVGTTQSGSHLLGVRELPNLLGEHGRVHVAHISAYCRGLILGDPVRETLEALDILSSLRPRVVSESHLVSFNSTGGECRGDTVVDHVTRNCLRLKGYPVTRLGLRQAILDGVAAVLVPRGTEVVRITGEEALQAWELAGTKVSVSFNNITPVESALLCATRKDRNGRFLVDAIASDGGGIPRNVNIQRAFALVRLGALTRREAVEKLSTVPARMIGLIGKGHLGPGADADITVVDERSGEPVMCFVGGKPIMVYGHVVGRGATLLVRPEGESWARDRGLPYRVVDTSLSQLYDGA